ncbi:hypothetical protein ACH4PU_25470 [Streptomyces sp. NPDC021100]|uniref:hypothetical protein n=1 Tax=Streptomyces sp. NPDC021100 TaxID=3365114 RepID=UPI0037A13132
MPHVSLRDFAFPPGEPTVGAGETVIWTDDESGADHTVTADDGSSGSAPPRERSPTPSPGTAGSRTPAPRSPR